MLVPDCRPVWGPDGSAVLMTANQRKIFLSAVSAGAHLPQLHGEHGHERNRPLHAHAAEEGGGRRDGAHAQPRRLALPVDQTQQPVPYPPAVVSEHVERGLFRPRLESQPHRLTA